jgi:uncharacterized surface protein with fasciclin (FAS1) repeats
MSSKRILILTASVAMLSAPFAAFAQEAPGAAAPSPAPAEPAAPAAPAPAPAAAAPASVQLVPQGNIIDTLKASGQFTVLLKALNEANLTGILQGKGPITLLAPTDAAFAALPPGELDNMLKPANVAQQLQPLLLYHIINTGVPASKIKGTVGPVNTGTGSTAVQIDGAGPTIKFNDANVESVADVSNGNVYAIDKVLTPAPAHAANPSSPTG